MIDASKFDAVSFDVYGTILNWEPEIARFMQDWASSIGSTIEVERLLAAYDRLRQPLQDERPALRYPELLAKTLDAIGDEFGMRVDAGLREQFSGIAAIHQPLDDSVRALADLRAMGLKLAALSNVDEASFAAVMKRAGIVFDVVVTAERVGAYKPDHAHFWAALADLRAMGISMDRVLHVAQSRRADIVAANQLGLTCVWVNRPGHVFGRVGRGAEDVVPDFEADSLATVVRMLHSG